MQAGLRLCLICLLLLLSLMAVGNLLAQDSTATPTPTVTPTPAPKTPLPVPQSPVVSLSSNIVDGVETGNFVITSANTTQFENAESIEWVAANESTRDDAEGTVSPSSAGTIRISARTLGYVAGHTIGFSLTMLAALDDVTYADSPGLVFCYPVHAACRDPKTLIRSLPPPVDASVVLVTPEPTATPAAGEAQAQSGNEGGTFQIKIPLRGTVINNSQGFNWNVNNSDGNSANGKENLNGTNAQAQAQAQAEAQAVEVFETIQFNASLIDYQPNESLRITLRTLAPSGSRRFVDSHPVVYYYCSVSTPNCAGLWGTNNPGGGNGGDGGDGGDTPGGSETCLNTDLAAPIKVCVNADNTSYTLYGVFQDSTTTSLSIVDSAAALYNADTAANDNLASGTNAATNKTYTVSYDGDGVITLSTYYADKGPDVDKPYIITIDTHNTVRYVRW